MESREGQAVRLGSLDTLRGVAILAVIIFHSAVISSAGIVRSALWTAVMNQGVQLFFLVSAYTMCTMWGARRTERHRAANFYIRRLCRIAPLYWAAIVLYGFMLGWRPLADIAANAVFVHSAVPSAINSVVPGGWSIGVEVAFYLAFPALAGVPRTGLLLLAIGWYGVFGVIAVHELQEVGVDGSFLYYSPLTQIPVFFIGMYVFRLINAKDTAHPILDIALVAAWIAIAVAAKHQGLPGRPFFWIGIAAVAAVMGLLVAYRIELMVVRYLGQLSYSMYLLHFAAITLVFDYVPHGGTLIAIALVLAGTTAASYISFRTGERWSQTLARKLVIRG